MKLFIAFIYLCIYGKLKHILTFIPRVEFKITLYFERYQDYKFRFITKEKNVGLPLNIEIMTDQSNIVFYGERGLVQVKRKKTTFRK